jgi:hypothetical protein
VFADDLGRRADVIRDAEGREVPSAGWIRSLVSHCAYFKLACSSASIVVSNSRLEKTPYMLPLQGAAWSLQSFHLRCSAEKASSSNAQAFS